MGTKQSLARSRKMSARRQRTRMSPAAQLTADAGVGALAAATGFLIARGPVGVQWPYALIAAVVTGACAVAWRRWPVVARLGLVLACWVVLVPVVTFLFSATTLGLSLDYQGRLAALVLFGVLVVLLSYRYSVGREWLTAVLVFGTVLAVAALAAALSWSWGLWPAYGLGLIVLGLRAGGMAWLWDMADLVGEWWESRRGRAHVDVATWTDPRSAELATATLLSKLPPEYRTIHDRVIPGSKDDAVTIDHIVIGPGGVIVLASLSCMGGKVTMKPNGSLWHAGQRLDEAMRNLSWQAAVVAHVSGLPTSSVLVLQGTARIEVSTPLRVALFDHRGDADEQRLGEVSVVPGGIDDGQTLRALIEANVPLWEYSPSQVKRYRRRVCRALPARRVAEPSSWQVRDQIAELYPESVDPVAVDDDGEMLSPDKAEPPAPEHREYEWGSSSDLDQNAEESKLAIAECSFKIGDSVHALRPDGMLVGWVVVSDPYIHADHALPVLDIAEAAAWAEAQDSATETRGVLAEPIVNLISPD